jgi:HK97 gp10 family phage protein
VSDDQINITGADQVIKNLSKYAKAMVSEIVAGCEAVQANVIANAHERVPFVTGNLHDSILPGGITITDDNIEAVVVANANYASFVEFGTSRQRSQPYLGPALLENQKTFVKAMGAAVKRAEASL